MEKKVTATLFLLLLLSAHALEVRNKIHDGIGRGYVFLEELEKELRLDSDVVKIKGDNTDIVHLTPGDVIDIKKSLKEAFNYESSPVFMEVNSFTPLSVEDKNVDMSQHRKEISSVLSKAVEPLGDLHALLEVVAHGRATVDHSRKFGALKKTASRAYKAAGDYMYERTAQHKLASGSCQRSSSWSTCAGNEECMPDPSDPCQGFCQCNTDGINNCECVKSLQFPPSMSKALDDTHAIGKSLTLPGAAFSGVFGFVDGFLGGMMSDIIEPWNTDQKCKDLKEDFSDGLRKVVHSFKHLLHSLRHNCKRILTSREARRNVLRAIKKVLREMLDFFASVSSGLWHCPATKMIGITIGIISAAIAANVAFLAAGLVVVPLLIKWVGAMVGLYFSFEYLMATGKTLARNVAKARRRNMCRKSCKEAIVEKSFAIAGCLTEVVVMGAVGDIISFGRANPAKVAAAGSKSSKFKVRFNDDLIHDLRVLKVAAINAKHKAVGKFSSLASKFKSGKQLKASAAKPKKTLSKVRGDDFYSVKNRLGGADNPIKSMDEAEDLMRQNKFACDAGENGPVGRNPILDDVKKKEGTISDEMYQKELRGAKNNAESFHNGEYNVIVLDEPITLYRAGPADRSLGQFWTRTPPKNRFEVRYNAAVKTEWSNLDSVYKVEIPAGTRMMEGYVAAQGGKYVGQGKQIFISKPWDIPGVKEGVTKIGHWSGNSKSFSYIDGAVRHLPTLQARGAAKRLIRNRGKSNEDNGSTED